ncbi:MAG TPA: response regulator [Patescibacteria group bacterium]|nr:response regulator [Patescibacteria group bacterium]
MPYSNKIILLVEDDPLIRKILSDELKVNGFAVEEAADGEECLAAIDSKNIDLVLLDIMIPKKDGIAVLRELKQAGKIPQLPVYILSALSDMEKVAEGIALGARGYFVKQESGREEIIKAVRALFAPQ